MAKLSHIEKSKNARDFNNWKLACKQEYSGFFFDFLKGFLGECVVCLII